MAQSSIDLVDRTYLSSACQVSCSKVLGCKSYHTFLCNLVISQNHAEPDKPSYESIYGRRSGVFESQGWSCAEVDLNLEAQMYTAIGSF